MARARPEAKVFSLPIGDGGEGTVTALSAGMANIETVTCDTVDALRRPIRASYAIKGSQTALIESAAASGLTLIDPEERDILKADTFGTGLLILDAYRRGIRRFIVCMGGTATCDGGYGAYEALRGEPVFAKESSITLLCDVENPLCGPQGAAAVFAPQKGASQEMIPELDNLLSLRARGYARHYGVDMRGMKYAGAAGGLAGMLMACFGAVPVRGITHVLQLLDFPRQVAGADMVITGEGRADASTLFGKAPMGVLESLRGLPGGESIPVALVCGRINDQDALREAGFDLVVQATPDNPATSVSPAEYLSRAVSQLFNA